MDDSTNHHTATGSEETPQPSTPHLAPQRSARWHEFLIYFLNRPSAAIIIELIRFFGDVVYVPTLGYFINDPDIGQAALRDGQNFTSGGKGGVGHLITQVMGPFALLNMDGIDHRMLKTKLADLFAPTYVASLVNQAVGDLIKQLKDDLEAGKEVDLAAFIHRFTAKMICFMIGVTPPKGAEDDFYTQIYTTAVKLSSYAGLLQDSLTPKQVSEAKVYFEQLAGYAKESYEQKNVQNNSVTQRLRDMGLSFDEVKGLLSIILLGGTETVSASLPRIVALLIDTKEFKKLQDQSDLLPKAIEEGLRFVSPSSVILRSVANDTVIENHKFKKDHRALIVIYHILKSKKYYAHPRTFDIEREQPPAIKYMWFGGGPHFCLGFNLAHRELNAVLSTILSVKGKPKIIKRSYSRNVVFPSYTKLIIQIKQ